MKKHSPFLLILFAIGIKLSTTQAQGLANPTGMKVNMSGIVINRDTAQVERVLNRHSSIMLAGSYSSNDQYLSRMHF